MAGGYTHYKNGWKFQMLCNEWRIHTL